MQVLQSLFLQAALASGRPQVLSMDQKIPLHSSHSEEGKQNQEEKQIFQDFKKEKTETEEAETRINKNLKPLPRMS